MTCRLREAVARYLEHPWGEEFVAMAEAYAMTEGVTCNDSSSGCSTCSGGCASAPSPPDPQP